MSLLLAVVVKVGAVPPLHLTLLGQVTIRLPVPSCTMMIVTSEPLRGALFQAVNVTLPVKVNVRVTFAELEDQCAFRQSCKRWTDCRES